MDLVRKTILACRNMDYDIFLAVFRLPDTPGNMTFWKHQQNNFSDWYLLLSQEQKSYLANHLEKEELK